MVRESALHELSLVRSNTSRRASDVFVAALAFGAMFVAGLVGMIVWMWLRAV
jgi:hypothetical protein